MINKDKYLYYQGDLDSFKNWIATLDKTSEKYKELYQSIVWIHPDLGKTDVNIPSDSGWIYAHGSYFSATSVENVMSVKDGRIYINGKDVNGNKKQYKLLNSTDVINRTEEDDGIVTYSYLKTSRMFEALN